jgi:cellulose biosynthesis protein BcsQ
MASIAVYSVKGGVGKTTLSVNLAWCASAISRRKTLLWDLDAANGSGFLLGIDPRKNRTADSLFAEGSDPARLIQATAFTGLDLLPALGLFVGAPLLLLVLIALHSVSMQGASAMRDAISAEEFAEVTQASTCTP